MSNEIKDSGADPANTSETVLGSMTELGSDLAEWFSTYIHSRTGVSVSAESVAEDFKAWILATAKQRFGARKDRWDAPNTGAYSDGRFILWVEAPNLFFTDVERMGMTWEAYKDWEALQRLAEIFPPCTDRSES